MLAIAHVLFALTLFGVLIFGDALQAGEPLSIEVFTTPEFRISGKTDLRLQGATVIVHFVDGLEHFESALSEGLPADAGVARVEALRRIGELSDARVAPARSAAIGLATAVQYGVDRYPAIVFDGAAVVYGVADMVDAVARYDAWHQAQLP
jgi:integrating conjugative element protein (TIGR03757 family)